MKLLVSDERIFIVGKPGGSEDDGFVRIDCKEGIFKVFNNKYDQSSQRSQSFTEHKILAIVGDIGYVFRFLYSRNSQMFTKPLSK